jgi:hypothetical protein
MWCGSSLECPQGFDVSRGRRLEHDPRVQFSVSLLACTTSQLHFFLPLSLGSVLHRTIGRGDTRTSGGTYHLRRFVCSFTCNSATASSRQPVGLSIAGVSSTGSHWYAAGCRTELNDVTVERDEALVRRSNISLNFTPLSSTTTTPLSPTSIWRPTHPPTHPPRPTSSSMSSRGLLATWAHGMTVVVLSRVELRLLLLLCVVCSLTHIARRYRSHTRTHTPFCDFRPSCR